MGLIKPLEKRQLGLGPTPDLYAAMQQSLFIEMKKLPFSYVTHFCLAHQFEIDFTQVSTEFGMSSEAANAGLGRLDVSAAKGRYQTQGGHMINLILLLFFWSWPQAKCRKQVAHFL